MSHLGRKHQEQDNNLDKIMLSTPKYGRDSYDSRVSHLPGELMRSNENELSNVTEQGSRKENEIVSYGDASSVSQQVASSSDAATRALELTNDGKKKQLLSERSMRAFGDPRSSDINSVRTTGSSLLDGDEVSGDSSRTVLMETTTSRFTSGDDKRGGSKSTDHSSLSKPIELGFQYEDIQSFRERQKIEGEGLQLHRRRLSGNIVGTVKKGDVAGGITSPDSGYSSGITTDLEKSGDSDVHHYTRSVREYKSYGMSQDDRLGRDKFLTDDKSGVSGSHLQSRVTSHDSDKSSRDGASSSDDRLARLLADDTSGGIGSHLQSRVTSHEYKLSRNGSSSSDDLLARDKLLSDPKSSGITGTSNLHSGITSRDSRDLHNDRFSRERLLAEARGEATDTSVLSHLRNSDDYRTSGDRNISGVSSRLSGDVKSGYTDTSTHLHTRSSVYKSSSAEDAIVPRDEKFSKTDALVAKYLDSSRHKSKRGSDIVLEHKQLSSLTEIKEEEKENGRRSHVGKDRRYDLPRRKSYDWEDSSRAREQAINRLLDTTRRYSVDSILDTTSHDKKLDNVIGAMSDENLRSSRSYVERHVRETKLGEGPEISKHDALRGREVSHRQLSTKTSSESEFDRRFPSDGDSDRLRLKDDEKVKAMSPDDGLNYPHKETQRTRYQTPYTSLDHSHYMPTPYGENIDDDRPIRKSAGTTKEDFYHPGVREKWDEKVSDKRPDYPPPYQPSSTSHKLEEVIYDKLRRGSDPLEKPKTETARISGVDISKRDNQRGSIEGLDEPVYERLYLSSGSEPRPSKGIDSPVPMSDHFELPLDKYDKPIPLHGMTKVPVNPEDMLYGREIIVSKYPERQLIERPRGGDFSDFIADGNTNVRETTRTSVMQRSLVSRNGEVIKDEVQRHDEIRHGGQKAIERDQRKHNSPEMPTRIQRYPAVMREEDGKVGSGSRKIEDVQQLRDTNEPKDTDKTKGVTPNDHNLDEVMKLTGLDNTGDVTTYQQLTRRDDVTRIQDDSNFRTKVHRTDVNTNVNIVKEISAPKRDKPKSGKLGIADLRSKIDALTKSVDELMNLKKKTVLRSYVKEHAERRGSRELVEELPKIERYEVKSKRYEPKEIELDQVDYVYKELELEEIPKQTEHVNVGLNIQSLWLSEEQQTGKDIGLHVPKQINLVPDNKAVEWWNAATAEDADRFLCIGDWKWWNANTTEGIDHILGIEAINKETGATGAIIAKYQGEEKPVQWAWIKAAKQPTPIEKRRTLTRVLKIDSEDSTIWDGESTTDRSDQHLGIGDLQWWNANTTEAFKQLLGVRGSNEETRTILATYDDGTKPTAWTWVQTTLKAPEVSMEKRDSLRRSSRDMYVDETDNGKVELLIRVKDEETQDPRFIAIRPGPVEKAIIVHQAVESELPYTRDIWREGKQGGGLTVKDGVVQMKIKDLTPEEREAWVHIMGMEDGNFKLQEHETFEIPVKFVDEPRRVERNEDIYAVPIKKNKRKPQSSTKSVKSAHVEEKKKLEVKKSFGFDKKKKEKKEFDAEKKKRGSKIKKLDAAKKRKEDVEKKTEKDDMEKKKREETEKKKKEEKMKLENKRDSERIKENEMEKKRKEQQKKKEYGSVKKEKVAVVKGQKPPPVDRSTKPKSMRKKEINTQDVRRHSDVDDAGKVEGGSFSPQKTGPFAMTEKGVTPRAQSARARMTSFAQSKSSKTVFEERGGNLRRKASPSVKVVKRVSVTQSGKTRPYSPDQTDAIKHKSGSLQRRSGGSIAVPLRGGASKQSNGSVKVISNQPVQNQMPQGQNIRQTIVQESHSYKTETHITSNDGRTNAVLPQIAAGKVGPGHNFRKEHIGAGQVHGAGGGQEPVRASHIGADQGVIGHSGAGNIGLQNVGVGNVGVEQVGGEHVGVQHGGGGHVGVQHGGAGHVGVQHGGGEHVGVQQVGGEHVGVQHGGGENVGAQQVGGEHVGVQNGGGGHVGVQQDGGGHVGVQHSGGGQHFGESHVGGQVGARQVEVHNFRGGHYGRGQAGVEDLGGGQGHVGAGHLGSVVLHNMPTESSTDYSHDSGIHKHLDGSYVQRNVSHIRTTSWAVEEVPTKGQTNC